MFDGVFWNAQPSALRQQMDDALRGSDMAMALLVKFDFASETVRLCNWTVPVVDGKDGDTWLPLPTDWGVADIEGGPDNWAPLRTYSLLIDRDMLQRFGGEIGMFPDLSNKAEYHKRPVTMYLQIMRLGEGPAGSASPLGYPVTIHSGKMDKKTFRMAVDAVMAEMRAEGFLARKRVQGAGLLTPRDQRTRHPDDKGLDYIPEVQVRPAIWPDY